MSLLIYTLALIGMALGAAVMIGAPVKYRSRKCPKCSAPWPPVHLNLNCDKCVDKSRVDAARLICAAINEATRSALDEQKVRFEELYDQLCKQRDMAINEARLAEHKRICGGAGFCLRCVELGDPHARRIMHDRPADPERQQEGDK